MHNKQWQDLEKQLIQTYKVLHQFPEIGLQQFKTTAFIRQYASKIEGVTQIQAELQTQLKTGCVFVVRKQCKIQVDTQQKQAYLFRADIDALNFKQQSGLEYQSQNGLHHACGHDAHTSILLISMKLIARNRQKLKRDIYFFFQPGEQGHGGASKLLQKHANLLSKVKHCFALHVGNYKIAPMLVIPSQYATANSNAFTIQIKGKSAHCMMPYAAVDANYIGCQIVNQIYTCRSRLTEPTTGMSVSVTKVEGGMDNVAKISDKFFIKGSIRSYDGNYHQKIIKHIQNFSKSISEVNGAQSTFTLLKSSYRAVKNQKQAINIVVEASKNVFQTIQFRGPSFAGQDFCEFSQKVSSCYFNLVVGLPDSIDQTTGQSKFPIHSNKFKLDEKSLIKGCQLWLNVAAL